MAIKLGDLYVQLSARNTEFGRGMAAAGAMVSKFAMQVKAAGSAIGGFGMMMAMAMGAALMKAATQSSRVAAELNALKQSSLGLAVQVANALLPAVHMVSAAFSRLTGFLQRMDPDLKQQIGTWAAVAAGIALAIGAFSKVMGVVGVFGKIIQGVGMLLSSGLLLPIIAVVGIVAGLITIVGLASQAWDEFGDGITDVLKGIWDKVKSVFTKVADVIGTALTYIQEAMANMLRAVGLDSVADALMDPSGVLSKLKSFGSMIIDFGVETGKSLKKGFMRGLEDLGIMSAINKAKGAIGSVLGGAPANYVAVPSKPAESGPSKHFLDVASSVAKTRGDGQVVAQGAVRGGAFDAAKRAVEDQRRLSAAVTNTARALQADFMPKLGKIGQLFEAAKGQIATGVSDLVTNLGGGAAAGGIIGAIVGVIASLIGDSEGFMGVIEVAGAVIQTLANLLSGPFLVPVQRVIAALMPLAEGLGSFLAPLGSLVSFVADVLIPPLVMLGMYFQALGPAVNVLAVAVVVVFATIVGSTLPVLQLAFEGLRWAGIAMLTAMKTFAPIWNGMLTGIASFLRSIAGFSFKIGEVTIAPFSALGDLANQLDSTKISTAGLQTQIDALTGMTWAGAQAKAEETRATVLQTQAVQDATAAMLNVPTGFNVAFERWKVLSSNTSKMIIASLLGGGGPISTLNKKDTRGFAVGGVFKKASTIRVAEGGEVEAVAPLSSLAKFVREAVEAAGGGGGGRLTVVVQGSNKTAEEIAREVKRVFERENFRAGRGRLGGLPLTTG